MGRGGGWELGGGGASIARHEVSQASEAVVFGTTANAYTPYDL